MNIEEVLEIITSDEKVNFVSDFMICPVTYDIFEEEPDFSLSYDMLKDVFNDLEINDDFDEQEQFIENNSWICKIEIDLMDYETIILTYGKTLEGLAKNILNEFNK